MSTIRTMTKADAPLDVPFLATEIVRVPIDSITPHPANPNVGDVGAITESIESVGFYSTVYVQTSTGSIIAGEHRWRALKAKGSTDVPVVYLDVDDETAMRIMVADNELPRRTSHADDQALAALLTDLTHTDAGLRGLGWDGDDLDRLIGDIATADGLDELTTIEFPEPTHTHILVHCRVEQAEGIEAALEPFVGVEGIEVRRINNTTP